MCGYKWQGQKDESRILKIDIYAFVDNDFFECKEFCVQFLCSADAKDFLSILDRKDFHNVEISKSWKNVYLKPKGCESCRKALNYLRGYDFLPKDIEKAFDELHLIPGSHWFDIRNFHITQPY